MTEEWRVFGPPGTGRGRPRTLPDAEPRACKNCGEVFTPVRKKWKQAVCTVACQRRGALDTSRNAELSKATAERRGDTLRGRGDAKGYRKRGGRHEHRIVAEEMLGRPLLPGEIVHHKDGDRANNAAENLEVITQSAHINQHRKALMAGRQRRKEGN